MKTYIVIGAPGQGKSPWVKKFIQGNNCFVNDVQNEYGPRTKYPGETPLNLPTDYRKDRSRFIGPINEFIRLARLKRNTIVVCEESTQFFRGANNKETAAMLINKFHTRNVYIFLFHSINRVPPEQMEMCDFVILFKTNDSRSRVKRKYEELLPYFDEAQKLKPGQCLTIDMMK